MADAIEWVLTPIGATGSTDWPEGGIWPMPSKSPVHPVIGATGSVDWPETPKGLNGPTGPAPSANEMMEGWRDGVLRPIAPTSLRDEANDCLVAYWKWRYAERRTEITELRAELTTLRARVAERDASVAWAIKRGR